MDQYYKKIQDGDNLELIAKQQPFDPIQWLKWFKFYSEEKNSDAIRYMRLVIQEGTFLACKQLYYTLPNKQRVNLASIETVKNHVQATCCYTEPPKIPSGKKYNTVTKAVNQDCIEVALEMKNQGLNPVVLNMASRTNPVRSNSPRIMYLHFVGRRI